MVRVGVVLPISMRVLRRLVAEARLVEQGPALDVARAHADHVASAVSDVFEAVAVAASAAAEAVVGGLASSGLCF